ncbi:MAG: aldehyde dehydrogenase family protein [Actinomycetota bacterium]|nr:aldehyde dehydrogenase family protein [Actinomycetota bacterium]MDP1877316.1 aldehyde dehydrogenase family protein [Actinomycetota bacterium]
MSVQLETTAHGMPLEHYGRNFIAGKWQFPKAPFEFEIRNPLDSSISGVVPLSSRFDVESAVIAGKTALAGPWAKSTERELRLNAFLDRVMACSPELAHLQSVESGLSMDDSSRLLAATVAAARGLVQSPAAGSRQTMRGVTGHILSWGLAFTEMVTSLLPSLIRGDTVVVKPSLRGSLTPVAFCVLAADAGLPGGVINLVQGTGVDVGGELIRRRDLSSLHVRAGDRIISQALRRSERSGVATYTLSAGGNVTIVGSDTDIDAARLADAIATGVRVHNAGGPYGLPLLALHRDQVGSVLNELLPLLSRTVPAPLPTEPVRQRARDRVDALVAVGAEVLLGGSSLPDDVEHRMGWRMRPTVVLLGEPGSQAVAAEQASSPLGPVLSIITWSHWHELTDVFNTQRASSGIATVAHSVGTNATGLPHGLVESALSSRDAFNAAILPAAWWGGVCDSPDTLEPTTD